MTSHKRLTVGPLVEEASLGEYGWVREYTRPDPVPYGTMVTRLYTGPGWHVKWFVIGFLTGGIGWFIWPFAYAARKKPRTVARWE